MKMIEASEPGREGHGQTRRRLEASRSVNRRYEFLVRACDDAHRRLSRGPRGEAGGAVQGGGEDGTDEQQPDQHLAVDGQGVGGGGDRDYPYRDNQYRRRCDRLGHRCPDVGVGPESPEIVSGPGGEVYGPCRPLPTPQTA